MNENPDIKPVEPEPNEAILKQRKGWEERMVREKEEAWKRHLAALPQAKIDDAEQIEILKRELAERDAKAGDKKE